jgi:hypothetical protein
MEEYLGSLSVISIGHRLNKDPHNNVLNPEKVEDELKNKLGSIINMQHGKAYEPLSKEEKKQWEEAAIRKLAEIYPDNKGFIKSYLQGEVETRTKHVREHLKHYADLDIFKEETNG